jgi:hypothetical protein
MPAASAHRPGLLAALGRRAWSVLRSPNTYVLLALGALVMGPALGFGYMLLMVGRADAGYSLMHHLEFAYADQQIANPGASIFALVRARGDGRYVYRDREAYPVAITDHGDAWMIDVEYDPWFAKPLHAAMALPKQGYGRDADDGPNGFYVRDGATVGSGRRAERSATTGVITPGADPSAR